MSETKPIARKAHHCGAYENIMAGYEDGLYTYQELRQIVKMRRQKGKILPGQQYIKFVGVWEGDFGVFKASLEMHDICDKYDLYRAD